MLLKSGFIVAFFTLLSRFFGLAREFFIAALFGTTYIADCVNVAFKFPNLFRRIFGEGALSAVFIPMFSEKLVTSGDGAKKFAGKIFSLLLLFLIVITLFMQIFMHYIMFIIAPGFYSDIEKFNLAVSLCQITTPYLIFISASALLGGMLNSVKRFAAFAFVPIILNISIIAATYLLNFNYSAQYSVAYSIIIGGILQLIFMKFCIYKANLQFSYSIKTGDKDVKKLLLNMGPATLSSGSQQLMLFLSQSIASFLPGAVSILSYAERLYQLPLALIGISFGTVLLPELSKIYKQKDYVKANKLQNKALTFAVLLSAPAMIGLFILAQPIIHLIYERGAFTREDTIATGYALAAFSLGVPAFIIAKIITPIFYANLDTKTPLRLTIYSLFINTSLNIALMVPFGYIGIALGSSIASWINIWLLKKHAKKYGDFKITKKTKITSIKILICSIIMGCFAFTCNIYLSDMFYSDNLATKLLSILSTISLSGVIFFLCIYASNIHKDLLNIKSTS